MSSLSFSCAAHGDKSSTFHHAGILKLGTETLPFCFPLSTSCQYYHVLLSTLPGAMSHQGSFFCLSSTVLISASSAPQGFVSSVLYFFSGLIFSHLVLQGFPTMAEHPNHMILLLATLPLLQITDSKGRDIFWTDEAREGVW